MLPLRSSHNDFGDGRLCRARQPQLHKRSDFFWRSGPQFLHPIPSEVSLYLERGQIRHHPFFKAPYTILECS